MSPQTSAISSPHLNVFSTSFSKTLARPLVMDHVPFLQLRETAAYELLVSTRYRFLLELSQGHNLNEKQPCG
jgi:hypothetical protein